MKDILSLIIIFLVPILVLCEIFRYRSEVKHSKKIPTYGFKDVIKDTPWYKKYKGVKNE